MVRIGSRFRGRSRGLRQSSPCSEASASLIKKTPRRSACLPSKSRRSPIFPAVDASMARPRTSAWAPKPCLSWPSSAFHRLLRLRQAFKRRTSPSNGSHREEASVLCEARRYAPTSADRTRAASRGCPSRPTGAPLAPAVRRATSIPSALGGYCGRRAVLYGRYRPSHDQWIGHRLQVAPLAVCLRPRLLAGQFWSSASALARRSNDAPGGTGQALAPSPRLPLAKLHASSRRFSKHSQNFPGNLRDDALDCATGR
ncbi:hypothetical protein ABIF68_007965 [Bradyrhizobium japonicum]